ncbi:2-succinyl-6-hydroxy-2,4-cyclohexadiene-1-carboxylate synthase [Heyndrickxia camelliae]|uniref:Putative 2-succinyl-6-hydroxy-2,4-cyclohexadiene-1-carboxylate synthase n=1 Tax=Heyndrickxia camelliae TaxID=1707093 RepID=A0A2N3LIF2_9BACI|nr:2-succinyl-6-hydroxy-2,4-cyclohexadiene-1-carboxylate synthase [Heyndrickxia camelliae]PKR84391.1 2-succinyl-6-hydroxy-2,4-cyclohexadiene-1-carboxylate synthase [Heyndrickxia camelliae]
MDIHNVQYHIKVLGEGQPVVLLHGFTGDFSTWTFLADFLKDHYKVILVDILGHGKTDCPNNPSRYDIELIADDLKEILDKLAIKSASILGYSMGGRLALTFAQKYPDRTRRLILESASPGLEHEKDRAARRKQDKILAERIIKEGIEAFVDYWSNIPLFDTQKSLDSSLQKSIRLQRLSNDPVGLANSLLGMGTGSQPSWWDSLKDLPMPILLMTGALDYKFCKIAEEMKNKMPHAKWVTIPNVGHAIHVESPRKFGTIVREFLTEADKLGCFS